MVRRGATWQLLGVDLGLDPVAAAISLVGQLQLWSGAALPAAVQGAADGLAWLGLNATQLAGELQGLFGGGGGGEGNAREL